MKTAIKTASTAIKRWLALYQLRSIEITLAGALDTLPSVRCQHTRSEMQLAIAAMRRELAAARARYIALLPPGQRITWELA